MARVYGRLINRHFLLTNYIVQLMAFLLINNLCFLENQPWQSPRQDQFCNIATKPIVRKIYIYIAFTNDCSYKWIAFTNGLLLQMNYITRSFMEGNDNSQVSNSWQFAIKSWWTSKKWEFAKHQNATHDGTRGLALVPFFVNIRNEFAVGWCSECKFGHHWWRWW